MRVLVINWTGVMPKIRLMLRTNLAAGIFAMLAKLDGEIGSA